jgi:hypothetical protein
MAILDEREPERWLACVLPVGDGIGVGTRRSAP